MSQEEKIYKLALIGYPLGHSLSPVLYNAIFNDLGIKGSYELLPTEGEDLINQLKFLRKDGFYGFNVTIPHKIPITLFISKYDEFANMTNSVNTVKIEEDLSLSGYNTDVYGFITPLKDINLKNKKAAVLGTGGASRAICAGLSKLGVSQIDIYSRNAINAMETVGIYKQRFPNIQFKTIQNELMNTFEDVDILVNTTPLGMRNFKDGFSPVDDKGIESLPDSAIVYDIVYNPLETPLISKAIKYNKKYIEGLDMLIYQAIKAFEIWSGLSANYNTMKIAALEEFLKYKN